METHAGDNLRVRHNKGTVNAHTRPLQASVNSLFLFFVFRCIPVSGCRPPRIVWFIIASKFLASAALSRIVGMMRSKIVLSRVCLLQT